MLNEIYLVVYDKTRNGITTFLPPDAIHNYLPLVNGIPQIEFDRKLNRELNRKWPDRKGHFRWDKE